MIRLASRAAVAALCMAGTPAIATEAPDSLEPSLSTALDEWRGAVRFWGDARAQVERDIAAHPSEPLVVDDLTSALACGDGLVATKEQRPSAARLHLLAIRLWAVISHIANVTDRLCAAESAARSFYHTPT